MSFSAFDSMVIPKTESALVMMTRSSPLVIGGMRSFLGPPLGALFYILFREFLSIYTANWLLYFSVADVDATIARARKLGATIPMDPEDIPDVGRICPLIDPTGAPLAVMKPLPRAKP